MKYRYTQNTKYWKEAGLGTERKREKTLLQKTADLGPQLHSIRLVHERTREIQTRQKSGIQNKLSRQVAYVRFRRPTLERSPLEHLHLLHYYQNEPHISISNPRFLQHARMSGTRCDPRSTTREQERGRG